MTTKKPHKPWRVEANGGATSFRGQAAAYDHVKTVTEGGHVAMVWHFEDGRWWRYEDIPAAVAAPVEEA